MSAPVSSLLPDQTLAMRTTLYNQRSGSAVAPSPLRSALNRSGASSSPRSSAATTAERRRASAVQQRKAERVRDTQSQHLEGDDEDGGDQSAWPSWKEQPMPKQRAAHASTRQPRQASTQLSSFSEARAEVLRGSQRGEASTSKHQKEADNLARIDRKIEATLRPAPPEEPSSSRPPVRQPRVAQQATSPGGERAVDMGRPDAAGQQPLVYAAHHGDIEAAFALLDQPGTDANCRDAGGRTVLMIAACGGHGDLVRLTLTLTPTPTLTRTLTEPQPR